MAPEDVGHGSDLAELLAILVLQAHNCHSDCLCQTIGQYPAVAEEIRKIGKPPQYKDVG